MKTTRLAIWFVSLAVLANPNPGRADVTSIKELGPTDLKQRIANHKATLLFFFVNDCPISRRDVSVVNELRRSYPEDVVEVVATFVGSGSPAPGETPLGYEHITVVSDADRRLVNLVGARTTPQYFVFDQSGALRYQGAFDDYALGLTRHRKRVTKRYVAEAVAAVLKGESVPVPKTPAYGCVIEPREAR